MNPAFDVIVLGLGGMGSASACHLARRGQRVLGLEQFRPAHDLGSSHGKTRIIRQAYFEDPCYVPLLRRAYELWDELERTSGEKLLTVTGGLFMGKPQCETVAGALRSARQHGLEHELLNAAEIRKRWPAFTPSRDTVGVFEAVAGIVPPERAVATHLQRAESAGASLRFNEKVLDWRATAQGGIQVKTTHGIYEGDQLVITAGPWISEMAGEIHLPLKVERKVMFWFEPTDGIERFAVGAFPVWCWDAGDDLFLYGFPAVDGLHGGVKVAAHREPKIVSCQPDAVERDVSAEELALMRKRLADRLPGLGGRCVATATCLYTNAPDGHFVLDRHPEHPQVVIVSPCSGHGFKFTPVIGEVVADLVTTGTTLLDVHPFRLARPELK
jgi:sarcosine oxidase